MWCVTEDGSDFLQALGVDMDGCLARAGRKISGRMFCRPCLDWSERRSHIAGAVGAALCQTCFTQGWVRRLNGTRAVEVTPAGQLALDRAASSRYTFGQTLCVRSPPASVEYFFR